MAERRITVELVGDDSRVARAARSLREKLEGPRAMREILAAAHDVCAHAHVPAGYVPCGDCEHTRCLVAILRAKLAKLDEIRTGA